MSAEPEDRLGMTEEQWKRLQEYTRGYGEQNADGVDISLLRENLRLTPTERLEKMRSVLAFQLEVYRAGVSARLSSSALRA